MKYLILIALYLVIGLVIGLVTGIQSVSKAQFFHSEPRMTAYISAGGGYNAELEAASVRFYMGFPASREFFSYSVDGGFYVHNLDKNPNSGDININLRFYMPGSVIFRPYAFTGANYTYYDGEFWGVNLGVGTQLVIGRIFYFVRAQYTVGELNMASVSSGLSLVFPTSVR
jgi:hypothetical protein